MASGHSDVGRVRGHAQSPHRGRRASSLPTEQSLLPQTAPDASRTALFARYTLIGRWWEHSGRSRRVCRTPSSDGSGSRSIVRSTACSWFMPAWAAGQMLTRYSGCRHASNRPRAHARPALDHRKEPFIAWQRCSAWIRSPADSPCSRCWRCGCSSSSISRSRRPARSSSGADCSRHFPSCSRRSWRSASA